MKEQNWNKSLNKIMNKKIHIGWVFLVLGVILIACLYILKQLIWP